VDNIKMHLREMGWGGMEWVHVTQDRDQWGALVNTVMSQMLESSCVAAQLAASQEGLSFVSEWV
jgi:hypothetical protein